MSVTDANLVDEIVEHQFNCLHIVYAFVASIIVYLAWCSTYVRDYTQLDLNRRRTLYILNPQTGIFERHPVAIQRQNGGDSTVNAAQTTDGNNGASGGSDSEIDGSNIVRLPAPPQSLESILDEVSGFTTGVHYNNTPGDTIDVELIDEEAQAIIRDMDSGVHTQEGVRQRRLAFFQNLADNNDHTATAATASTSDTAVPVVTTTSSSSANISMSNPVVKPIALCADEKIDDIANAASPSDNNSEHEFGDELTIKLKYLNDDLRIVKGRPSELIGDFKK